MAGDTIITVVGNLTADPELRFTAPARRSRTSPSRPRPARSTGRRNEWKDGEALFLRCNIWRQAAENVAESLTRGSRVIVTGRLKQRSFETQEGEKRTVIELRGRRDRPVAAVRHGQGQPGPARRRWRRRRRWSAAPAAAAAAAAAERAGRRPVGFGAAGRRRRATPTSRRSDEPVAALIRATSVRSVTHTSTISEYNHMAKAPPPQAEEEGVRLLQGERSRIDYKDTNLLRRFISDRGKIRARRVTGNCTQHQRDIAMAVKNAREVALLPYTSTAR